MRRENAGVREAIELSVQTDAALKVMLLVLPRVNENVFMPFGFIVGPLPSHSSRQRQNFWKQ